MAQLIRRLGAALLAITLALLALASPATDNRVPFQDGRLEIPATAVFVPIRPSEFLPYEQKQGPPYDLLAQVTTNPSVTGDCPPGTQTVTGVTGWIGRCEERSFAVALQNSLIPEEGRGDRTPTFTRATTAYQTDFEGKQNLVLSGEARFQGARRVRNLLSLTENFSGAGWTNTNITIATNVSDPNGGTTASTFTSTASGESTVTFRTITSVVGSSYLNSVYLRRRTGTGAINLRTINNVNVDISGVLTPSWKRFATSAVAATGTTGYFVIGIPVSGDAIDIWHPQAEDVTSQTNQNPSEYVSVGVLSAPYQGAGVDGVQYFNTLNGNTVSSNIVSEATGAAIVAGAAGVAATAPVDAGGPFGYLAEGARADVLGTTAAIRRTMADAGWVATNVTKGTTTGIDGTANSAATLTATAGNGTVLYTTVLGAAVRTYSAWVSRITGTGTINMTKDGGATWTPITLTSTPTQFQVTTASAANPVVGFQIVTAADAIEVDFNTLEAATFANPTPIPVNVSKAADGLKFSVAGNVNSITGSAIAEVCFSVSITGPSSILDSGSSGHNYGVPLYIATTGELSLYDGTTDRKGNAFAFSSSVKKVASVWGGAASQTFNSGVASSVLGFDGDMNLVGSFGVGTNQDLLTNYPFGTIRNVKIFPTALSPARAKAITSHAADWLGSPFWRMAANDDVYRIAVNQ